MPVAGLIITCLTFPGVVVHEFAHALFCQITGTRIVKVCLFRFGNPAGYVLHERPPSTWRHILIGIGPLFVNTLLGLGLGVVALPLAGSPDGPAGYLLLLWLAVSVAMHSFPSTGDAKAIWGAVWRRDAPLLAKLVGTPLVAVIYAGAVGSFFWLDLAYGVAVAVAVPRLLGLP
jgi:hypothetical protein